METVTLILTLEAMPVNNPSNSSGVKAGAIEVATAAVTAVALIDLDRATDSAIITQC